jgi:hypothetical protein
MPDISSSTSPVVIFPTDRVMSVIQTMGGHHMVLILGILAILVAIVLWVAKVAVSFVASFGVIGIIVVIVGLVLLSRGRGSSV